MTFFLCETSIKLPIIVNFERGSNRKSLSEKMICFPKECNVKEIIENTVWIDHRFVCPCFWWIIVFRDGATICKAFEEAQVHIDHITSGEATSDMTYIWPKECRPQRMYCEIDYREHSVWIDHRFMCPCFWWIENLIDFLELLVSIREVLSLSI